MISARRACVLAVLWLMSAAALPAAAQTEIARQQEMLRGLSGFRVVVNMEAPSTAIHPDRLDLALLQREVAYRLREGGIPASEHTAGRPPDEETYLLLHVNAMSPGMGVYPFSVEIGLYQPVSLARDRSVRSTARTWHSASLGIVSQDRLPGIHDAALNLLDEFIEDYVAMNRIAR